MCYWLVSLLIPHFLYFLKYSSLLCCLDNMAGTLNNAALKAPHPNFLIVAMACKYITCCCGHYDHLWFKKIYKNSCELWTIIYSAHGTWTVLWNYPLGIHYTLRKSKLNLHFSCSWKTCSEKKIWHYISRVDISCFPRIKLEIYRELGCTL